jgi:single-strand DNA-binding protein
MYSNTLIVGNVGTDPEIKYLKDGTAVCNFSCAVNKVTGKGESRKEVVTWFKIAIWRDRAETAAQLIKKGTRVLLTGEVSAEAFIDKKTGEARASLILTANEFRLLSSRAESEGDGSPARGRSDAERRMIDDADEIPF